MRWHHPNWRSAWIMAGTLVVVGGGCRSQQTPLANPFLAPDRVPPPTTRTLAPGTAQPYYPGDPLPVMQSVVTPPAAAVAVAPANPTQPVAGFTSPATRADETLASAGDRPVAIPDDGAGLRFALPTPAATPASRPSAQLAAVPTQAVQPALYTAPATSLPMPTAGSPAGAIDSAQLGPWRQPRVASVSPTAASPMPISPMMSATPGAFVVTGQPDMSVRLRPVPSPESESSPTPRIRLPGYASNIQQPMVLGGGVQTVQITELPGPTAAGVAAPTGYAGQEATQPTYVASAGRDGFRPRGSTR